MSNPSSVAIEREQQTGQLQGIGRLIVGVVATELLAIDVCRKGVVLVKGDLCVLRSEAHFAVVFFEFRLDLRGNYLTASLCQCTVGREGTTRTIVLTLLITSPMVLALFNTPMTPLSTSVPVLDDALPAPTVPQLVASRHAAPATSKLIFFISLILMLLLIYVYKVMILVHNLC